MDFVLTEDQRSLQHELRRLLAAHVDKHGRAPGVDRDLWGQLGAMGVFALTLPEADGGVGLGLADAVVVFEELGRAAVAGPLVDTFVLAGLVEGAETGAVVVGLTPRAEPALVEHPGDLDVLVVDDGPSFSRLSTVPAGDVVARPTDPLTPVAVVHDLPAGDPLAADGDELRDRAGLLAAAMQVGLGQAAVDLGVLHAKEREQFGKPIGAFQAVKHLLADATVAVETARAAVHAAAVTTDEGSASARARPGARLVASHAADLATRTCIQVHGGMGFTWELDAHLFLKRSLVLDTAFGGVEGAYEAVAGALT
jgi:alkylation response protein AidB-like acyl-CoA dehydrogenase